MNQKIKFLREILGLSEKEISSFLNISSYKYISLEKTAMNIPFEIVLLLSRIYGINIEFFLDSRYDHSDLLFELSKQGLVENNKAFIIEKLKQNLLQGSDTKITYHLIRKTKGDIQQNIINFINALIREGFMGLQDFAQYIDIDTQSLNSILTKKRFIAAEELITISKQFETPISDIINYN